MAQQLRHRKSSKTPDSWFMSLEGCEVDGFRLEQYLGCGKIGYVYRAIRKDLGSENAVKLIPGKPKAGWQTELKKVSKLHAIPGVVHFHALGTDQITHDRRTEIFQYTVWDYISPGRNLKAYLHETESLPVSFLLAVIERVLHVLHACRAKGVPRHGDLHAGNILIGEQDDAVLDNSLLAREPIYVSDFGYGTTGGDKKPKDDYRGLAAIANAIIEKVEWDEGNFTDRQMLYEIRTFVRKHLYETCLSERHPPRELLQVLRDFRNRALSPSPSDSLTEGGLPRPKSLQYRPPDNLVMKVGQFQVSEMLGDEWQLWKRLFVPSVPARSRILEPDISTVVTGPRGCGKTMLFRRLSERLSVECGPIDDLPDSSLFTGLYVNANDIADAFSSFPSLPSQEEARKLICYANLCILSDFLAIQSARRGKFNEAVPEPLISTMRQLLVDDGEPRPLVMGEDPLDRYRSILEKIKWSFLRGTEPQVFPGFADLSQHTWLRQFISAMRGICPWLSKKAVFVFIDDYTTPRVSTPMQRVLNRLFFQRSNEFVSKVATESATTFIPEDSSGKVLQDGDDYHLIDMGEESLFMSDIERARFLDEVFARRLLLDHRIPLNNRRLPTLLGSLGISKTEFARRLRGQLPERTEDTRVPASSQRRGPTRPRVLYHGWDTFTSLWSGDTRTMIQLVQELLDQSEEQTTSFSAPLDSEMQDRVFRNRGGQWLEAQARNQPTDKSSVDRALQEIREAQPEFHFAGGNYGNHLKAIVEAFVTSARQLLLGPTYSIRDGSEVREVPRMAFRIEIVDEFRLSGLASELYKDLIRYGLFMRDARGKSVRGAMVPRLYLRRLLLPFCTLALSKRDSVSLSCEKFCLLLLKPDEFRVSIGRQGERLAAQGIGQIDMPFDQDQMDPRYDDLSNGELL
jgi:hypothetical protein